VYKKINLNIIRAANAGGAKRWNRRGGERVMIERSNVNKMLPHRHITKSKNGGTWTRGDVPHRSLRASRATGSGGT